MPKRGLISLIFTIAGLRLIVGYVPPAQAGIGGISPDPSATPDPSASTTVDPTPTTTPTPDPSPAPGASATPKQTATPVPTAPAAATLHNGTYTGSNFYYKYGYMKVTVTISGGKVTAASAVQTGNYAIGYDNRSCTAAVFSSAAINLAASSSIGNSFMGLKPDACSGATYSWWGYANSLQAAIDKATY